MKADDLQPRLHLARVRFDGDKIAKGNKPLGSFSLIAPAAADADADSASKLPCE